MKKVIKNNYKIIIGFIIGLLFSITTVYAIDAYIESNKVTYTNYNKSNVEEAIDELYERSGIHKDKWVDPILNGADPVLKEPLIPVEIKNNGDVYYANENSEWYNYSEKRWANAIILIDNPSNTNYKVGDHIIEDDIESYFVWIPRYQYKIWDLGNYNEVYSISQLTNEKNSINNNNAFWKSGGNNAKLIDIKFGTSNNIPKMSEPSTTGVYYTHPAFTLGDKNLNGIWVGKFETGGTSANNMVVKPNVVSWRNETVKVFFDAAKEFTSTELDSHMMKNTEWGAVAYLSHSAYGIGNNVNINNNSEYKTGYSATASTDQRTIPGDTGLTNEPNKTLPYNTSVGYLASTTGNISGIYDMSGGTSEYVAACIVSKVGSSEFSEAELLDEMNKGYVDKYEQSNAISFSKRILGDATGELGPFHQYLEGNGITYQHSSWYTNYAFFVSSTYPWFIRSGGYNSGIISGLFFFTGGTGIGDANGFRIVLAIQ